LRHLIGLGPYATSHECVKYMTGYTMACTPSHYYIYSYAPMFKKLPPQKHRNEESVNSALYTPYTRYNSFQSVHYTVFRKKHPLTVSFISQ